MITDKYNYFLIRIECDNLIILDEDYIESNYNKWNDGLNDERFDGMYNASYFINCSSFKGVNFNATINISKYEKGCKSYSIYDINKLLHDADELQKYLFMNDDNEVIHKIKQFIYYDIIL